MPPFLSEPTARRGGRTRASALGVTGIIVGWLTVFSVSALPADLVKVLATEQIVRKKSTAELSFDLPEVKRGQQVRLSLAARVNYSYPCANNPALTMTVNGRSVLGADLVNKPLVYHDKNGRETFWATAGGSSWLLFSWPDFSFDEAKAYESPYAVDEVNPFEFVWDITAYVKPGTNTVAFTHNEITSENHYLVLHDVRVEVGSPIPSKNQSVVVTPAPTGRVPTFVPRGRQPVAMSVRLAQGGELRIRVGRHSFAITSRTTEPDGRWTGSGTGGGWQGVAHGKTGQAGWTGTGYRVTRVVTVRDDHIHIADTFTNTTDHLVGIMLENALAIRVPPVEVKLGGRPHYARFQQDSYHPTALARWQDIAVGLAAEDDIYRAQVREFARPEAIGLADNELGIEAGKSHTLEWSIYPVPRGDYWDFINAVRRNWGCNIPIPGPTSFVDWISTRLSDEECRRWVTSRGVRMVCSYDAMFDQGKAAMGTAIPLAKKFCARTSEWMQQLHRVAPEVKALFYMNCSLCTEPGAAEKYADARLLDVDGKQLTMAAGSPEGVTMAPLFFCTPTNSYGQAMMQVVQYLVNDLKADGVYHDVFQSAGAGARAYHAAWDGCTVAIDPETHAVTGTMSSVALLQRSWEVALVEYLRAHGKTIIANGPVETRTLLDLKIPVFVETGLSYDSLIEAHLGTPWGYGNHPTGGSGNYYRDTAELVRGLRDYGGVLAIPSWTTEPQGETFLHRMYPITPLELRDGMVIGEERIITKRSGRYGWPDGSGAEVYVYDADGRRVAKPLVKEVRWWGKRLTEVRLPSDQFAILVRKRL